MTDTEIMDGQEGMEPKQRNTVLIAAVVIILLLLCCCAVLALGWFFGDSVVEGLSSLSLAALV